MWIPVCHVLPKEQGRTCRSIYSRSKPPGLKKFKGQYHDVPYALGAECEDWLNKAERIIVSPGEFA